MLWSTLFNKLGKQPLRITQHHHIHVIVEGKHYDMDLKFNAEGEPYLVPMQSKQRIVSYSAGRIKIAPDGTSSIEWFQIFTTAKWKDVLAEAKAHHADYIRRIVRDKTGHTRMHRYIMGKGTWEDWDGNPLPY